FAHFEGEVQSAKIGVAGFKVFHNTQRVQIMVEAVAVGAHSGIERLFPSMAERRMANIMRQRQSLDQVGIKAQHGSNGARDLSNFDGMRQAVAKMIRKAAGEDLRLILQAAKGARVDNAVTIALEIAAIGMARLRITAATRLIGGNRQRGKPGQGWR